MAALVEAEGGGNADAPGTSRGGGRGGGSQAGGGGRGGGGGGGGGEEGSREGSDEEGSDGEGPAPGELLAREAAGVPLNDAQRREAEVLRAAGITGGRVDSVQFCCVAKGVKEVLLLGAAAFNTDRREAEMYVRRASQVGG